jgi:cell division protein FtsW (lipid II flippase)
VIDRRQLRDFDVGLFITMLVIVVIGIVMIHSATHTPEEGVSSLVKRQLLWAGIGLIILTVALLVSQDSLDALAPFFYAVALLFLVAVLFIGVGKTGEKRWFDLGPAERTREVRHHLSPREVPGAEEDAPRPSGPPRRSAGAGARPDVARAP